MVHKRIATRPEFLAVGKNHILFAEIQFQLHQGSQFQQILAHFAQLKGISATQLVHCDTVRGGALRGDNVGNGLRLGKVHLTVGKSAARKLSRLGGPGAGVAEQLDAAIDYICGSMTIYLYRILARIGMRSAENGYENLVEHTPVSFKHFCKLHLISL